MAALYLVAVWIHILTVVVWVGAMFFEDPHSIRLASRLAYRMHGIGWYALAVLATTGVFMLQYHGIGPSQLFSADFIASAWGRAMWAKIALVLTLVVFQVIVGNRPSKLVYGYILVALVVTGISVMLVRPVLF